MNQDLEKELDAFLLAQKTLTIATVDEAGLPWITTVFYVVNDKRELFFLSGKDTTHSLHIVKQPTVAAAIHDDKSYFGKVWGVQAVGTIKEASLPEIVAMAIKYVQRFPESKDEFLHPADLISAAFSARFYKFTPISYRIRFPGIKKLTGKSTFVI
jgi:uncharacterized protein YhbP (UPF0306 family)